MKIDSHVTKLLAGSLSNDLFRVANLVSKDSNRAAVRFLQEAKRWSKPLQRHNTPQYIAKIVDDVSNRTGEDISIESAERYLMYGILLQNYTLHLK